MGARKRNSPRIGPDTVIRTGKASDFAPVRLRSYPWEQLKVDGDCFVIEGLTETFGIKPPKAAPYSVKTWIADEGMVVERVPKRDRLRETITAVGAGVPVTFGDLMGLFNQADDPAVGFPLTQKPEAGQ